MPAAGSSLGDALFLHQDGHDHPGQVERAERLPSPWTAASDLSPGRDHDAGQLLPRLVRATDRSRSMAFTVAERRTCASGGQGVRGLGPAAEDHALHGDAGSTGPHGRDRLLGEAVGALHLGPEGAGLGNATPSRRCCGWLPTNARPGSLANATRPLAVGDRDAIAAARLVQPSPPSDGVFGPRTVTVNSRPGAGTPRYVERSASRASRGSMASGGTSGPYLAVVETAGLTTRFPSLATARILKSPPVSGRHDPSPGPNCPSGRYRRCASRWWPRIPGSSPTSGQPVRRALRHRPGCRRRSLLRPWPSPKSRVARQGKSRDGSRYCTGRSCRQGTNIVTDNPAVTIPTATCCLMNTPPATAPTLLRCPVEGQGSHNQALDSCVDVRIIGFGAT